MKYKKLLHPLLAILPVLASCENEFFSMGRDSELKFSANLSSVSQSVVTNVRSTSLTGSDGTEVPMTMISIKGSPDWVTARTRGELFNNNDNGDGSDIALESKLFKFYISGWNSDHSVFVPAWTAVSWEMAKWTTNTKYYWKQSDVKTFYAYANLPSSASVTCSNDTGQILQYSLPLEASSQKDILLGFCKSDGNVNDEPGIAEISFSHPLTTIIFRRGIIKDDRVIKSIKIRQVAASGSVIMGADGTLSTWEVSDYSMITGQSKEEGLPIDSDKVIGEPFILIPQNTSEHEVFVEVETTSGFRMEGKINTDQWLPGTTNVYTVGYGETTHDLVLTADQPTFDFKGGRVNLTMNTTVKVGSGSPTAVMWKMQYSEDGINWNDLKGNSHPTMTGPVEYATGFSDYKENSITIQPGKVASSIYNYQYNVTHDRTADLKPVWDANVGALQSKEYGSQSEPYDLSMHDIYGNEFSAANTANCYVVKGYGYFCLPLVYGNAIKGGIDNVDSYFPGTPGELSRFKSSEGYITSPYIQKSDGTDLFGCRTVWQDVVMSDEIVLDEDLKIIDYPAGALDCKYLVFRIRKENVKEGNVLLAVTNRNNKILWSWHIWVTPKQFKTTGTSQNSSIRFLNYNLGWTDGARGITANLPGAKCYLRIMANDGSEEVSNVVTLERTSKELNNKAAGPAGPYYQWGRKDPQKPADCVAGEGSAHNSQREAFTGNWSVQATGNYNIEYTISHPNVFFYNDSNGLLLFDKGCWYYEGEVVYRNLWSATNVSSNLFGTNLIGDDEMPIKTVYDPCPAGFQVPWGDAFYWLNHNTSSGFLNDYSKFVMTGCPGGLMWDNNPDLFFPAAGALDHDSKSLAGVGREGHYWSAVPQDMIFDELTNLTQGQGMAFSLGLLNVMSLKARDVSRQTYGCSVRPVAE